MSIALHVSVLTVRRSLVFANAIRCVVLVIGSVSRANQLFGALLCSTLAGVVVDLNNRDAASRSFVVVCFNGDTASRPAWPVHWWVPRQHACNKQHCCALFASGSAPVLKNLKAATSSKAVSAVLIPKGR